MADTRRASTGSTADERDVRTVAVDGRQVAYCEYGDPDGVPVLVLHGTPGSRLLAGLYDDAARDRNLRVLALDRPGYGRSDPWPDRTLADTGRFVAPVLDDAGVESVGVVGFSGGGSHALALAATHGDRVRAVDLVGTAAPPDCVEHQSRAQQVLRTLAARAPWLLGGLLRVQAWVARNGSDSVVVGQYTDDPDAVPDDVAALLRRDFCEAVARSRAGIVRESRLLAQPWDVELGAIDADLRLWHGERDANVPVTAARRLAMRLPDADLTVESDADHLGTLLATRSQVLDGQVDDAGRD